MTPIARARRFAGHIPHYLDAAANMRARQVVSRPRRLIPARALAAGRSKPVPGWSGLAYGLGVEPAPQSGPHPAPDRTSQFDAIGRSRPFPSPGFWTRPDDGLLFLFHLHGFAELAAYAAGDRTHDGDRFWSAVLVDWLETCDAPARPAWHPFPMSGRIMAWCAALSADGWEAALVQRMRASLVRQARVLSRSVEHEIGGNHVLRNAVALVFAGACLEDGGLERRALRLLERQLALQILEDGGHEERSTSYHRAILADLEDVRLLLERAGRPSVAWLDAHIAAMHAWLAALAGPRGDLPLLNDAWEGPALRVEVRDRLVDLRDTGYVALRGTNLQAVLDVGPVAPPHLPPHAHADALSFVLWVDGRPVIVDPGAYAYDGPGRDAFRATRSHNTLEVDGRDQCEFWGPFRAAFTPRVTRLVLEQGPDSTIVSAQHDGYRRLGDPVVHRRTFVWLPADGLVVVDRLLCRRSHDAVARLHLASDTEFDGATLGGLRVEPLGWTSDLRLEPARYAPYLGDARDTHVLVQRERLAPEARVGWALLREGSRAVLTNAGLRIERPGDAALDVPLR